MSKWLQVQSKAICRWISFVNNITITKLEEITSKIIIETVEIISGVKCPYKYDKNPRSKFAQIESYNCSLEFSKSLGVRIIGISGADLNDKNEKSILSLFSGIISRFISMNQKEISQKVHISCAIGSYRVETTIL